MNRHEPELCATMGHENNPPLEKGGKGGFERLFSNEPS